MLVGCGAGAAAPTPTQMPTPVAPAATAAPDATRSPAADPPASKPRPDCSPRVLAAKTSTELRAAVEAEGCNGHAWDGARTPLMQAAERGDAAAVTYLVSAGAPVDFAIPGGAIADVGKTALWFAVRGRHADVVRRLLAAGADPAAFPATGLPLVVLAGLTDDIETARALVEAGADASQTTAQGKTVMTYGAGPGAQVFAYLVGRGASTTGLTPAQVDALMWEAAQRPAPGAAVADQVGYHVEVLRRARTGHSRSAAAQALGALAAAARPAVPALIDIVLGAALGPYDWSQVDAAIALGAIGWTPELTDALPRVLAAVPNAPQQLRITLVELVAGRAPVTAEVLAALVRLLDRGPDRWVGARGLGIALARPDTAVPAKPRRAAIEALRRAARASDTEVRDEAARALASIGGGDG